MMENFLIKELEPHVCIVCGGKHIHRKTYIDIGNGIKEMRISYECSSCRLLKRQMKEIDDKIAVLKEEKLNKQFTDFCRRLNNPNR